MNNRNTIDSCLISHVHEIRFKTANQFASCDSVAMIDGKPRLQPRLVSMCKTSLLFDSLAVCVHVGCSAVRFYTPTKLLIWGLSGRVLDSRPRVRASPASLPCVLEQNTLILAWYWFNPGRPIPI